MLVKQGYTRYFKRCKEIIQKIICKENVCGERRIVYGHEEVHRVKFHEYHVITVIFIWDRG